MNAQTSPGPAGHGPLCPQSGNAVDALVECGYDPERVERHHRARCERLAHLLERLHRSSVPCCCADQSVRRAMDRIAAARHSDAEPRLSEADADALEQLVTRGWDARRVPAALRARAERHAALLALLDAPLPTEAGSADGAVAAVTARIADESSRRDGRMRIHEPAAARRSLRLTDLGAVAALLLVAVSVAWPALSSVRQRAQQSACFGGLGGIGAAMAQYGSDYRNSLPIAGPSLAGSTWWNVGRPEQSNSANLFTLARSGYTKAQAMSCAGNPAAKACTFTDGCRDWSCIDQVSYSYQNLFARKRPRLDAPSSFVVLADKNPCVARAVRGERVIYINENSPNHAANGQNVLFSDGHAVWVNTPVLANGDYLWIPRSIENAVARARGTKPLSQTDPLRGVEEPDESDAFVCP